MIAPCWINIIQFASLFSIAKSQVHHHKGKCQCILLPVEVLLQENIGMSMYQSKVYIKWATESIGWQNTGEGFANFSYTHRMRFIRQLQSKLFCRSESYVNVKFHMIRHFIHNDKMLFPALFSCLGKIHKIYLKFVIFSKEIDTFNIDTNDIQFLPPGKACFSCP